MHDSIASEVLCDIDQLYDLTDRPDVERYDWDGSDVEFNVTIKWEESFERKRSLVAGIVVKSEAFNLTGAMKPFQIH